MSARHWPAPGCAWKITHIQAGLRLRSLGLTYSAIAVVLAEYHGLEYCNEARARSMLRRHGADPCPRGAGSANLRRGTEMAS